MEIQLTENLILRISELDGLEGFPSIIAQARAGDRTALHQLKTLTLPLSQKRTWEAWSGPETMEEINSVVSVELGNLQNSNKIHSAQSKPITRQKTNTLQQVGTILPGITVPLNNTNNPNSEVIFQGGLKSTEPILGNPNHPKWRDLAQSAKFPTNCLTKTAQEILSLVERVLISGQGWGLNDHQRGRRKSLSLVPSQLSKNGLKRSPRTYQRAIKHLMDIGLLVQTEIWLNGIRIFTPSWWQDVNTNSPLHAWETAAQKQQETDNQMSDQCRTNVAPLSEKCRTDVAPPVPSETVATTNDLNELPPSTVRHSSGRHNSYVNEVTLGRGFHPPQVT